MYIQILPRYFFVTITTTYILSPVSQRHDDAGPRLGYPRMGGYEGKVSGHDGNERKRRGGIKPQREETDTRGLYPSIMPET